MATDEAVFQIRRFRVFLPTAARGVYHRQADAGECLATAARIKDGDSESWFREWTATADRVRAIAEEAATKGHRVSARDAYLRAATYYSAATYSLDGTKDPSRLRPTWETHRACWDEAAARFDPPIEKVSIPYEGTALEGYFRAPDASGARRPLVIMNNGSDGPVSAMWSQGGAAANDRGYNFLTFDGPGQNATLWRQNLYFRPDWEKVVTPVVEYALARPEVDPDRIAIIGISQGGYWVPRAVAFEHRIAAAVADPGVWDVSTSWLGHLPGPMKGMLEKGQKEEFDRWMEWGERFSHEARAQVEFRRRPFGLASLYDTFKAAQQYTLDGVADKIRCPLLILDPEGEQFWPGQSRQLYDALPGPKTLATFTAAEGAALHCEPLATGLREQRIFDWLAETLGMAS